MYLCKSGETLKRIVPEGRYARVDYNGLDLSAILLIPRCVTNPAVITHRTVTANFEDVRLLIILAQTGA